MKQLVCFENSYKESYDKDNQGKDGCGILMAACIDGYPEDENESGEVVARVWMTINKDVVIDWHDNGYRTNAVVMECINEAIESMHNEYDEAMREYCKDNTYARGFIANTNGTDSILVNNRKVIGDWKETYKILLEHDPNLVIGTISECAGLTTNGDRVFDNDEVLLENGLSGIVLANHADNEHLIYLYDGEYVNVEGVKSILKKNM